VEERGHHRRSQRGLPLWQRGGRLSTVTLPEPEVHSMREWIEMASVGIELLAVTIIVVSVTVFLLGLG
jgi:hypothetical protein